MHTICTCSVQELKDGIDKGQVALLDVREYPEWTAAHIPQAKLVPLSELKRDVASAAQTLATREVAPGAKVLLLCRSGRRAGEAAQLLQRHGYEPVVVEGGIEAWRQAGFPVQHERGPISLERQVRIVQGGMILLGLLVPALRPLAYLVGAGLIFVGLTDNCALGLLMAKLPWNRIQSTCGAPATS